MKFEQALEAMRLGCAVRRTSWNDREQQAMMLAKQPSARTPWTFNFVVATWAGAPRRVADREELNAWSIAAEDWEIVWTPPTPVSGGDSPDPEVIPG